MAIPHIGAARHADADMRDMMPRRAASRAFFCRVTWRLRRCYAMPARYATMPRCCRHDAAFSCQLWLWTPLILRYAVCCCHVTRYSEFHFFAAPCVYAICFDHRIPERCLMRLPLFEAASRCRAETTPPPVSHLPPDILLVFFTLDAIRLKD